MDNPLNTYGWSDERSLYWNSLGLELNVPARVIADFGSMLKVAMPQETRAALSGSLAHHAGSDGSPKVGDWVAVEPLSDGTVRVESVLPRTNEIARKATGGKIEKQMVATNIDIACVVQSLDDDFSPERLERYLYQLKKEKIQPLLILNKVDKVDAVESFIAKLNADVPYVVCSAKTGEGVDEILDYITPGKTAILLGSSGVGKSTLTNLILGRTAQKTQAVRESDSTGRHTTTHRELFTLRNGALLIDSPGIRELQLWGTEDVLDDSFDDIQTIASDCKFRNCGHGSELGCAIVAALTDGSLPTIRYENYLKMKRELEFLKSKTDPAAMSKKKKATSKVLKQHYQALKSSQKHKP